ncbi:MAG: hypothetical protein LBH25_12150 [Fibromonadaceae bacterium]|jgi:hypothetical protein|nr:hypothetical protein [Fibromonadaceae bacterium]
MANNMTPVPIITPIWHPACTSGYDIELPVSGKQISKIAGLKGYHYEEMVKKLNEVDKEQVGSVGYLLRKLWKKNENGMNVLESNAYNQWYELSEEKLRKKTEIGFYKGNKGEWGVHSDLLYDTYKKGWSKAYQITFYYFFRQIDFKYGGFSCIHRNPNFRFISDRVYLRDYQLWNIIIKDIECFIGSSTKLKAIHDLPKQDKAPLYDIICEVLYCNCLSNVPSNVNSKQFEHGNDYWLAENKFYGASPRHLAMGVFAHMASTAVVNVKALEAMRKCLPNSYSMFKEILNYMVIGLARPCGQPDFGIDNLEDIMPRGWQDKGYTLNNFDETLLRAYEKLRELFPGIYVNFAGERKHGDCGLRDPDSGTGVQNSAHKEGKALDLHHETRLLEIREFCESYKGLELGILEVESRSSTSGMVNGRTNPAQGWVHIGTRFPQNGARWTDRSKPYIFIG